MCHVRFSCCNCCTSTNSGAKRDLQEEVEKKKQEMEVESAKLKVIQKEQDQSNSVAHVMLLSFIQTDHLCLCRVS